MRIVVFSAPGIIGPFVFASLLHLKENVVRLILPKSQHSISSDELLSIASQSNVPYIVPSDLNAPDFIELIKNDKPDLILVATYDRRLPRALIDIPRCGAINIHPSLLPKYRGACPEFWAVRNGETETGVTIHYLSETFDTGPIIAQEKMPINYDDTLGMVLYRFASLAMRMVMVLIDSLKKDAAPRAVEQNELFATAAPLARAEDLRIQWNQGATSIYNLVRAANPVGGAWTTFRGFQLKVWHAESVALPSALVRKNPGEIWLSVDQKTIIVRCADGAIELKAVQQALYYILDGWSFVQKACVKNSEVFI